jgi:hypothetical protein
MAVQRIVRQFAAMGGTARLRVKDGQPLVTDNGQHILDVTGLRISDPLAFESEVNQWPGVVTVGVFAHQKAAVCLLGTAAACRRWSSRSGCRPGCCPGLPRERGGLRRCAVAPGVAPSCGCRLRDAARPPAAWAPAAGGSRRQLRRTWGSRRRQELRPLGSE